MVDVARKAQSSWAWRQLPPTAPAHLRLKFFRQSRISVAALSLVLYPPLLALPDIPGAVLAAVLLSGLLPAAVALDTTRPAQLDRAAAFLLVILAAVLSAGLLRGLPAGGAALLFGAGVIEALVVSGRRSRRAVAAVAALGALGLAAAGQRSAVAFDSTAVDLSLSMLALASFACAAFGLWQAGSRRQQPAAGRMTAGDIESAISETVLNLDAQGCVHGVSGNAERVLGLAPSLIEGRGLFELTLVADRPALLATVADCFAGAGPRNIRFRLRQGGSDPLPVYRWVELAIDASNRCVIREAAGEVAEAAMPAGPAADAAKERAAFLTTVNHELRTPLNAIIGFSEILANPETTPRDPERVREYARLAHGAGQNMLRMVSALVDVARLDAGLYELQPESVELRPLVESTVEAFRQEPASRSAVVSVSASKGDINAVADARAIRAILTELLSMAAARGGLRIEIAVTHMDERPAVAIAARASGSGHASAAALFGEGLAMTLVRGVMARHGGEVVLDSRDNRSATLTLAFGAPSAPGNGNVLKLNDIRKNGVDAARTRKERRRA